MFTSFFYVFLLHCRKFQIKFSYHAKQNEKAESKNAFGFNFFYFSFTLSINFLNCAMPFSVCLNTPQFSSSAKNGTTTPLSIKPIDRETYSGSKKVNGTIGCGYESNGKPVKLEVKTIDGEVSIGQPATQPTIVRGDANCDGVVELADAILIMQSLANPDKYGVGGKADKPITDQGKLNGDVDDDVVGLTANDALKIQKYLLHIISNL